MRWWFVLGLSVLVACGDNEAVTACDDGVRNGDETDVDCGGSCGDRCTIGNACDVGTDCTFAVCDAGMCVAPTEGPDPTGPITGVLDPAGTSLAIVTNERVRMTLAVPANAVRRAVPIRMTANLPANGDWTAIEIETTPPGLIFDEPAQLSIELPAGLAFDAESVVSFASGPEKVLAGATGEVGSTLSIETWSLGKQPVLPQASGVVPADDPGYWERFTVACESLSTAQLVPLLRELFTDLINEGQLEAAIGVNTVMLVVLQRRGEETWETTVGEVLVELRGAACDRLQQAATAFMTPADCGAAMEQNPSQCRRCDWQLDQQVKPFYGLVAVQQLVGEVNDEQACPPAVSWLEVVRREKSKLSAFVRTSERNATARALWRGCECANPKVSERPAGCPRLTMPGPASSFAPAVEEDAHWDIAAECLHRDQHNYNILRLFGSTDGDVFNTELTDADVTAFRGQGFDHCLDTRDMSPLGELAEVAPMPALFRDDAQQCASGLSVTSLESSNAIETVTAPPPVSNVSRMPLSIRVAPSGGTLELRGPIATLVCRDSGFEAAGRREADVITLYAHAGTTTVALDTLQANGAADVMPSTLAFLVDVGTTRTTLGLTGAADFELAVERSGPGCDGLYTTAELFRVHAAAHEDRIVYTTHAVTTSSLVYSRLIAYRVDATSYTTVFDANLPTAGLVAPATVGAISYDRSDNRFAVPLADDSMPGFGWGYALATGGFATVVSPDMDSQLAPAAGDHRGSYIAIGGYYFNGTSDVYVVRVVGPSGTTSYANNATRRVRGVSATGDVVTVNVVGGVVEIGSGGTFTATGATGVSKAKLSPDGATLYLAYTAQSAVRTRDRVSGTEQATPVPTSTSWAAEDGGLLFIEGTMLRRYDLATTQVTNVGPVPAGVSLAD